MSNLPTYSSWEDVPDNLKTKTGLGKIGLKLADGQQRVAVKTHWHYSTPDYDLYEVSQAIPIAPPTPAQLAAMEKARKQANLNSTCAQCGDPFQFVGSRYKIDHGDGEGAYICFLCRDRRCAVAWAKSFLGLPSAIILDTETTGLDDQAQIVDIAIINVAGEVLFNSLVKPTIPIPQQASRIHGITDQDVATAPAWPDIHTDIADILATAPTIAIYNAEYDARLIRQTIAAHKMEEPEQITTLDTVIRCAMHIYASWYGQWSDYHRSYRWQKLKDGDHRALGDCLATLDCIKQIAANRDEERY